MAIRTIKTPVVLSISHLLIALAIVAITAWISSIIKLPTVTSPILSLIGLLLLVVGFVFRYSAFKWIFKVNKGFLPKYVPERLITGGVFGISRNPAYAGILLMMSGAFLLDVNLLMAIVIIIEFVHFNQMAEREEKVLNKKFGKYYISYKSKVRRWL